MNNLGIKHISYENLLYIRLDCIASVSCLNEENSYFDLFTILHFILYFFFFSKSRQRGILKKTSNIEVQKDVLLVINNLSNLHRFIINISMFETLFMAVRREDGKMGYTGVDGRVVETIMTAMNASSKYHYPQNDKQFGKIGKFTMALNDVIQKKTQMAGNSRFLKNYGTNDIEYTEFVRSERVCVVVANNSPLSKELIMLKIFKPSTWVVIFSVLMISIILLYVKSLLIPTSSSSSLEMLNIFGIILGAPVRIRFSTKYLLLHCLCMLFSVVIIGIFQGSLIHSFSTVTYNKNLETFEELAESDLQIQASLDLFGRQLFETVKKLVNKELIRTEDEDNWLISLQNLCIYKNISIIGKESKIEYIANNIILNPDGTKCLQTINECIHSYFITYIVPFNSPYLYKINDIIIKLRESGHIQHWIRNTMTPKHEKRENHDSFKSMTPKDLLLSLYILFLGHILAFLAFLCEVKMKKFLHLNLLTRFNLKTKQIQ